MPTADACATGATIAYVDKGARERRRMLLVDVKSRAAEVAATRGTNFNRAELTARLLAPLPVRVRLCLCLG